MPVNVEEDAIVTGFNTKPAVQIPKDGQPFGQAAVTSFITSILNRIAGLRETTPYAETNTFTQHMPIQPLNKDDAALGYYRVNSNGAWHWVQSATTQVNSLLLPIPYVSDALNLRRAWLRGIRVNFRPTSGHAGVPATMPRIRLVGLYQPIGLADVFTAWAPLATPGSVEDYQGTSEEINFYGGKTQTIEQTFVFGPEGNDTRVKGGFAIEFQGEAGTNAVSGLRLMSYELDWKGVTS